MDAISAVTSKDGKPYVEVAVDRRSRKVFSPEEVSAMILTKMKETAEVRWEIKRSLHDFSFTSIFAT